MLARVVNLVLLAALALAVSKSLLFLSEPPLQLPGVEKAAVSEGGDLPARTQPPAAEDIRPEAFDVIVARDLFSPTRGVVPPAPATALPPAPPSPPAPRLTLYGVVIHNGEKSAFIQEEGKGGRPRKVLESDTFAGGTVREIRPDGVTLLFDGQEISVSLRSPKMGATSSPVPRGDGADRRATAPLKFPRRQSQPGNIPGQARTVGNQGRIPLPLSRMRTATGVSRAPSPIEPVEEDLEGEEIEPELHEEEGNPELPLEENEE